MRNVIVGRNTDGLRRFGQWGRSAIWVCALSLLLGHANVLRAAERSASSDGADSGAAGTLAKDSRVAVPEEAGGEADLRVPMLQGREYFIVLAERGKTVRMVTYPGSPHFPILAEQRRNVFQELVDWLAKYNPQN